jgi:hypothetical protein
MLALSPQQVLLAGAVPSRSGAYAVVEVNDAAVEAALAQELKLRTLSGRARLPAPTTLGPENKWHSSTKPAAIAWPASSAPPMVMPVPRSP